MSSPGRPSTSSIDIQSLDADLNRFRSQLDQWADQVVARTVAEKDNHLRVQGKLAGASLPACSARVCDSFSKRNSLEKICPYTTRAEEIRALEREHQNLTEEAGRVRQRA
jgi:hypothetical protein